MKSSRYFLVLASLLLLPGPVHAVERDLHHRINPERGEGVIFTVEEAGVNSYHCTGLQGADPQTLQSVNSILSNHGGNCRPTQEGPYTAEQFKTKLAEVGTKVRERMDWMSEGEGRSKMLKAIEYELATNPQTDPENSANYRVEVELAPGATFHMRFPKDMPLNKAAANPLYAQAVGAGSIEGLFDLYVAQIEPQINRQFASLLDASDMFFAQLASQMENGKVALVEGDEVAASLAYVAFGPEDLDSIFHEQPAGAVAYGDALKACHARIRDLHLGFARAFYGNKHRFAVVTPEVKESPIDSAQLVSLLESINSDLGTTAESKPDGLLNCQRIADQRLLEVTEFNAEMSAMIDGQQDQGKPDPLAAAARDITALADQSDDGRARYHRRDTVQYKC